MPAIGSKSFQFWYLGWDLAICFRRVLTLFSRVDGHKPVLNRADAEVSWFQDGSQLLRMKIGYPISEANHPVAAQLYGSRSSGDIIVAEMPEDTADAFPQSTRFPHAKATVLPPSKGPSLAALLAEEKLAQKRSNHSLDPSRQLPEYMQKQKDPVASGRRNTNAVAGGSSNNGVNVDPVWSHDNTDVRYLIFPHYPCLIYSCSLICVAQQR